MFLETIKSKIQSLEQACVTVGRWKSAGERIVFTNGCFDLLHPGHVQYLAQARDLGQRLVVALNADDSVRRLKGPDRPIQNEQSRLLVMASLACVDLVLLFHEDTPFEVIQRIRPDVLVKGGDWSPAQIVGADLVLAEGGEVHSLPYLQGFSTTSIEDSIKSK